MTNFVELVHEPGKTGAASDRSHRPDHTVGS
jgi:hypothetical protein